MAPSDAAKMSECLAALVGGKKEPWPRSTWLPFVETRLGTRPASPNRQEGANGCEALWQANHGTGEALIRQILDFELWYHTEVEFMSTEAMTKEPVYATLHGRPPGIFAALAAERNHPAAGPCAASARSHAARVLLGLAMRPGRRILDHQKGARFGCVLVGNGSPKRNVDYVASAGQRSFVRAGKNVNGKVEFVDSITLPTFACQILGRPYPKKLEKNAAALWEGFLRRWPGLHPFGLAGSQVADAIAYASDMVNASRARKVAAWLRAPSQAYWIDRYSDGTVVTRLVTEQPSSTDELMIDVAYANGEIRWATCSDGVRSTQEDQESAEETAAYSCNRAGSSIVHRVAKPVSAIKVWSVETKPDGRVIFREDGVELPAELPPTPGGSVPPPPEDKPCPVWMRWMGLC